MCDNIRVRIVCEDEIIGAFLNCLNEARRNFFGAHLWMFCGLKLLPRRNKYAVLTLKRRFTKAVKEVSDVGIFFCFRSAPLRFIIIREYFTKWIAEFFGWEEHGDGIGRIVFDKRATI
ncbi:MAG: hypothetical protein ACD_81C00158G0001 [uncultured bacterium]|nr:MAG: hypothetical protein ACD_81C00158G0001 [uncultured bacterium]